MVRRTTDTVGNDVETFRIKYATYDFNSIHNGYTHQYENLELLSTKKFSSNKAIWLNSRNTMNVAFSNRFRSLAVVSALH